MLSIVLKKLHEKFQIHIRLKKDMFNRQKEEAVHKETYF